MELDLETKHRLLKLLAKPSEIDALQADFLKDVVKQFPYFQPLHLLLLKLDEINPDVLAKASLYNGGKLTHLMVNQSDFFNRTTLNSPNQGTSQDEQETFEEIYEVELEIPSNETDEVFEEIVELDPNAFQPSENITKATIDEINDKKNAEDIALENIVTTDFFAFEKSLDVEFHEVSKNDDAIIVTQPEEYDQEAEQQSTVSRYDDDKLPYTFLWWLAKTRKEHEQIFQPYVTPKQPENAEIGELQHQIVEHIFHLQTPFNEEIKSENTPISSNLSAKSNLIIDSFIKNDPQIKVPKPEQINNENKAKKSAEDNYDLVSETLASIYIEQMLYHKAIDTYEKLSLKYPEKSRYFADLIQSLEKKI